MEDRLHDSLPAAIQVWGLSEAVLLQALRPSLLGLHLEVTRASGGKLFLSMQSWLCTGSQKQGVLKLLDPNSGF